MREREREKERASERERKRASERERKRASENEIEIECEREEATSGNAWVTPPSVSPVPHAHVYNPGGHNWCRAYVWVTPQSASPVPPGVMAWQTRANRTQAAWAMHVQASDSPACVKGSRR